ncbi:MAG: replication-associated recombination protein A [Halioglobus sp.]|nr:replication-associated recombination protein A [Halioglobus sp.]
MTSDSGQNSNPSARTQPSLFADSPESPVAPESTGTAGGYQPLAARLRPRELDDYAGQQHLLAPGKPLRQAIESRQLHSMIFWGPPGVGKTTLARIAASHANAHFLQLSAVLCGVKEIREAITRARANKASGRDTVLFVDEVHRFNKSQQDAFLPYVEDGTVIFIGATTENPSFELNNALLSRSRVYKLRGLEPGDLEAVLARGLEALDQRVSAGAECLALIARQADGDARRALNLLELAADLAEDGEITTATLDEVLQASLRRFDKGGDLFYDQISALHKAVRGSAPDAALYWFCRMLDGGCDPLYIARRVVRMASEDIGNADPRALALCLDAWQVQERLGSPEGELAIAQAIVYLACAAKSNAVYTAYKAARADVEQGASHEVPLHLRNAPTRLMKEMDHGADYRYAHDEEGGYAAGENYFPEALQDRRYYQPVDRGLESKILEKFKYLRELDKISARRRYRDSAGDDE